MNIFEYLCREARNITENSLEYVKDPGSWRAERGLRRRRFADMLGLTGYLGRERSPPEARTVGVVDRDDYSVEEIYFESLPGLYVTGNLYLPKRAELPAPAVLYLCGHAQHQKFHYQLHARKFARLGFVVLIIETIQLGEIPGYHHGTYRYGWFNWYSLGYTPAGVEVWNAVRALDLLETRREVDPGRMGVTGISGGGAMSWYVAAVDDRSRVVAPVCGTATIESHVCKRTIEGHCDCMFWINNYMWDLSDVGALVAPRPLLVASAEGDWIFDIESVRKIYGKLRKLYELLGAPENIRLVVTPGPHSYHEISRREVFAWFVKHLRGLDVAPEDVGDVEDGPGEREPLEVLSVFKDGIPLDERTTTVQEWFIRPPPPPRIASADELDRYRRKLVDILLEKTFSAFPETPCDLDVEIELVQESEGWIGYRVGYTPEDGWRLHMQFLRPREAGGAVPIVLALARSARELAFRDPAVESLSPSWGRVYVEVRGVGESSWGPDLQWLVRRAAMITGRTIASMRVYDAIRAVDVVRGLEWVDRENIAIMGSGEMAVVALYAALLRNDVSTVILHDPPSSLNVPSNPDGSGPAIEMLNCLRYTDLPYVAGLLWPARLVFLGPRPETYAWAEDLYVRLGPPGAVRRVKDLSQLAL